MASAGWGGAYASNPFAQQAAAASAEQAASAAADKRQSGAFGAWGAGVGSAPTAAAAPEAPSNVFAHAVPAVNGGGGMSGREAELQRREAELAKREAALAAGGGVLKNWPSCCPFIYHNIREQIPPWNRSMMRVAYLVELISIAGFFYNAIIILATLFAKTGPGLTWFFLSVLVLVMGVPLSWWFFYKSLYNSAQTDGATYSYMRSFILIILHGAWCVWMVMALPNLGSFSAGVFPMLDLFRQGDSKSIAFGVMYIINVAIWGLACLGCWLVLPLAVAAYRRGDQPRRDREYEINGIQMNAA